LGLSPTYATFDPSNGLTYIPNSGGTYVNVLRGTVFLQAIQVGYDPWRAAYDPRDGYVYVPDYGSSMTSVFDGTQLIANIGVGDDPCWATADPENGYVYISNCGSADVTVIDDQSPIATLAVGQDPESMAFDALSGYIYVANNGSGTVSVISGLKVLSTVSVGRGPSDVTSNDWDGRVYVSNLDSGNVSIIVDTTVVGSLLVGPRPSSVAFDPWDHDVYVTNAGSDTVSVLSPGYIVRFDQLGLPDGEQWSVNVSGLPSGISTNGTLEIGEGNGTYNYSVASSDPTFGARGGTFEVNGADVSVRVAFSRVTFTVTVFQLGLWPGTPWWIAIQGGSTTFSNSTNLSFREPNGSYIYSAGTTLTVASASGGTFTVHGIPVVLYVTYDRQTYAVSFQERGLPIGTPWSVNMGGSVRGSIQSTIVFWETNGTYPFTVPEVRGWSLSEHNGTVTVAGSGVRVPINWSWEFNLTFAESGLPARTEWGIILAGGLPASAENGSVSFLEKNGTYGYVVWTENENYSAPYGFVTVDGSDTTVTVQFTLLTYAVSFVETGLPVGQGWSVGFEGLTVSSGPEVGFPEVPNGTYAFTVFPQEEYTAEPSSGTVTVQGSPVLEFVQFLYTPAPPPPKNSTAVGASPGTSGGLSMPGGTPAMGGVAMVVAFAVAIVLLTGRRGRKASASPVGRTPDTESEETPVYI
jgi:YVTN family beta-propeller protein